MTEPIICPQCGCENCCQDIETDYKGTLVYSCPTGHRFGFTDGGLRGY